MDVFRKTLESASLLFNSACCANPECNQTSDNLCFMGTICKHPFCSVCVNKYRVVGTGSLPTCPRCLSPLETVLSKIYPAQFFNSLSTNVVHLQNLIAEFEASVKIQGGLNDFHMTQKLVDDMFDLPEENKRSVDDFIETQKAECGTEGMRSRPSSRSSAFGSPPSKMKRSCTPDVENVAKKMRLDDNIEEEDEQSQSPKMQSHHLFTDTVPEPGPPVMSSTQFPDTNLLFMTQAFEKIPEPLPTPKSMVFSKPKKYDNFENPPAVTFASRSGKKGKKVEAPWPPMPVLKPEKHISNIETSTRTTRRSAAAAAEKIEKTKRKKVESDSDSDGEDEDFVTPKRTRTVPMLNKDKDANKEVRKSGPGYLKKGELAVINGVALGNLEMLTKAIEAGENVNQLDLQGKTALYMAVEANNLDMVELLVTNGATINAHCGSECNTALHVAVENDFMQIVRYLLSKGASKVAKNIYQKTPSQLAQPSTPMRKLVEQYKGYPRAPSIPPMMPQRVSVIIYEKVELSERDRAKLAKMFQILPENDLTATHMVVPINDEGVAEVEPMLLKAMLKGIHVVHTGWLDACLSLGALIEDSMPYEVQKLKYRDMEVVDGTVQKIRRNKEKMEPGLLRGCKFFLYSQKIPNVVGGRALILELIRLADGEVLNREPIINSSDPPPYYAPDLKSPYFILYDVNSYSSLPQKFTVPSDFNLVTAQWLLESIVDYSIKKIY